VIVEYILLFLFFSLFVLFANFAEKNDTARIILYVILAGICASEMAFALLSFVVGKYLYFLTELSPKSFYYMGGGLIFSGAAGGLLLLKRVRRALPLPIDPNSTLHATGLFVIVQLSVIIVFFALAQNPIEDTGKDYSITNIELVINMLFYFIIAFLAVGFPLRRNFGETVKRLALARPTFIGLGLAILFCIILIVVDMLFSAAEAHFFPEVHHRLNEILETITLSLSKNMVAVLLFGISAGVGEELVFRGALQPRYGILLTSLFFSLMHTSLYGLTLATASTFVAGILFGLLRKMTDTTTPIIAHTLYDIMVTVLNFYF